MQKIALIRLISAFVLLSLFPGTGMADASGAEKLTRNDRLFREDIQYWLDIRLQNQVYIAVNRYKVRISKIEKTDADRLTDSILQKVETILRKMRTNQPLDRRPEKKADDRYLAYMLLKFELMLLR